MGHVLLLVLGVLGDMTVEPDLLPIYVQWIVMAVL